MRQGRRYMTHRQAYFPRLWPIVLVATPITVTISVVVGPGLFGSMAIGFVIGSVIGNARFWFWRRRHPILTTDEWIQRQRDGAQWN